MRAIRAGEAGGPRLWRSPAAARSSLLGAQIHFGHPFAVGALRLGFATAAVRYL